MKHSIKTKILCSLLSVLLVMQIVPFSSFAVEETSDTFSSTASTENISEDTSDILYEVVEKRDEFTKVYKLTDGSFYEIKSFSPIHEFIDGEWQEIVAESNEPDTIEEALCYLNDNNADSEYAVSMASSLENITTSSTATLTGFSALEAGDDEPYYSTDSLKIEYDKSVVFVKPDALGTVPGKTRVVVNANIILNCNATTLEDDGLRYITASQATSAWNENTTEYNVFSDSGEVYFDCVNVTSSGNFTWNITELYNLWERGEAENNGVILSALDEGVVTITTGYFVINYREISPLDENFSHYSIDMGRAGTVYINEFTNDIVIVRDDLSIDGNVMPVSISSMYYNNNISSISQYGNNWSFNYSSSLIKGQNSFVWNMIGGKSVEFKENTSYQVGSDGLSKWEDENGEYILWVNSTKSNSYDPDFSSNYITSNDSTTYAFDKGDGQKANLIKVEKDENTIEINYENGKISEIIDGVGRIYAFEYGIGASEDEETSSTDELIRLTNITASYLDGENVNDITFTTSDNQLANISISYEYTQIGTVLYLTSVIFADGEKVSYGYDTDGNLITITNIDNTVLNISSLKKLGETVGKKYIKSISDVSGEETVIESISIDDHNTYQRIVEHDDGIFEKFYFNRFLKRQYYRMYTLDEDECEILIDECYYEFIDDGSISSLFTPDSDEENMFILNESFETKGSTKKKASNWNFSASTSSILRVDAEDVYYKPYLAGSSELEIIGNYSEEINASQTIDLLDDENIEVGDTIAIGGLAKVSSAIPAPSHFCGIKVIANFSDESESLEVCRVTFDTNIINEWQYVMSAFEVKSEYNGKTIEDYTVMCCFDYQEGDVRFDGLKMYETDKYYTIKQPTNCCCSDCSFGLGCPCECENEAECACEECNPTVLLCNCGSDCLYGDGCSCVCENSEICDCVSCKFETRESIESNTIKTIVSDGTKEMITSETNTTDGNYLYKTVDENGCEVIYTYNQLNGLLESVEDAQGKTEYSYNAMRMLTKVSMAVSSLSDGETKIENCYNYTDDKLSSITHNGFTYYFYYNEYGDYTTIKVEDQELVSYEYNQNQELNKISYGNGDIIRYTYSNGQINEIYFNQDTTPAYVYNYNEDGTISKIVDNIAEITTEYNTTLEVTLRYGKHAGENQFDVVVYRTNNPRDIRYAQIDTDEGIYNYYAEEEYSVYDTISNYDCVTGTTTTSTRTDISKNRSIITASTTDIFGRRINPDNSMSINENSWNETTSTANTILQKDALDLVTAKSETSYYYSDTETQAFSEVTGYSNKVSKITNSSYRDLDYLYNLNEKWGDGYNLISDNEGTIITVYTDSDSDTIVARYEYNSNGQIIKEEYGFNELNNPVYFYVYTYDENGKVNSVTNRGYQYGSDKETVTNEYNYGTSNILFNETNQSYYSYYASTWSNQYSYEYDECGNITKIFNGLEASSENLIARYHYDEAQQLVREDDSRLNKTYTYTYDAGGNLTSKNEYAYTTEGLGTIVDSKPYVYNDSWNDKLVSFDGKDLVYDAENNRYIYGDPTNTNGEEYRYYEWQGSKLVSCSIFNNQNNTSSNVKYVYTYNEDGLRSSKTLYNYATDSNGVLLTNEYGEYYIAETETGTRTEYLWENGKLVYIWLAPEAIDETLDDSLTVTEREQEASMTIKYLYDENDEPYGMITNEHNVFYFVKNMHGDVERIISAAEGVRMITYRYDAWGNMTYTLNSSSIETMLASMIMLGNNVITYRGYTYDFETNLYYLQSRYYSPEWGRFISADSYCDTETSIIGTNMFAYCDNNPVNYIDPEGFASVTINVYSGAVGHADITIDSTTYAFGNYDGDGTSWRDQVTGRAKGFLIVATSSSWLKYQRKDKKRYADTFTIYISESEKNKIKNYCLAVYNKGEKDRVGTGYSGDVFRIKSGTYSKYNILLNNCVKFTVLAMSNGISEKLINVGYKSYKNANYAYALIHPFQLKSFMLEYMKYYSCYYKRYSKL